MNEQIKKLINKLESQHSLTFDEYVHLIKNRSPEAMDYISSKAQRIRKEIYGNRVYVRGLIEFSNYCKNDCLYCGIRCSNKSCDRYRLTKEEILACCHSGFQLGFRTFVLQGGEDPYYTDDVFCDIIHSIKYAYPNCAVTLSAGERSRQSYEKMYEAGADRYLLRHETADKVHYETLHPAKMSYDNRMKCLQDLKEIGYQTGCGFMVGSPNQTPECLASDLKFLETFQPDMCGIGPFIPHKDTPFSTMNPGTMEETLWLLSIIRLMLPYVLLPSTTALGTIHPEGRELGILAGANVVMPNLSPDSVRKKYELYDNKICTGPEAAEAILELRNRMESIGYEVAAHRGDVSKHT